MISLPRQARRKSKSGVYHIMLRGANKQEIFHDNEDNARFMNILNKYKKQVQLKIFAWCLMNNHVHLLIKEGEEELSVTMKRIAVSYVQYYNKKYSTTGHLFQDRFKSENVETKRYFLSVVRYIHQNPVKAGMVTHVKEWYWSSCCEYYHKSSDYQELLDRDGGVLRIFSDNRIIAIKEFQAFNEKSNADVCFENEKNRIRTLTDEEARKKIKMILGSITFAQVKSLSRTERNDILRKVKTAEGISQRQASRILGVSLSIIHRA
ncbi:REP-associated tyrosine transposase [Gracilibacillus boraciitolerans]|uniref:REP-associated tyrosine transposase n=1 Tax=Gracilibacillus boraciitolerans TaxID=307521 RepID=UPI001F24D8E1|nr:transposase [Gracilibacillus boraciitolerans]